MNLNRFDLITLRLFVYAVHEGSLTAAAVRVGISLAAASKRIAELENHLGMRLLFRSKHGVKPTGAGQILLRHSLALTTGLEHLAVAMNDFSRGSSEHLRLWANTSAFSGFLAPLLAKFLKANPNVILDLEDALSEDAAHAVSTGRAELAIIGNNTPIGDLKSSVCNIDELVVIVPQDHELSRQPSVTLAQCLAHDLIALPRATSLMRQVGTLASERNVALKIRAQVSNFDAMSRMVAAGLGVGIMPRLAALPHLKIFSIAEVRFADITAERRLLVVMRDTRELSAVAKKFLALLQRQV